MGVPPSLPSWDKLKSEGVEYLAAEIADQTGLPPEVAAKALDYAQDAINQLDQQRGGSDGLPDWILPDIGLEPASMRLTLWQQVGDLTSGMWQPDSALWQAWIMPGGIFGGSNEPFLGTYAPLPRVFPTSIQGMALQKSLSLPVVLQPNLANVEAAPPHVLSYYYHICGSGSGCSCPLNQGSCVNLQPCTSHPWPEEAYCTWFYDTETPRTQYEVGVWNKNHWAAGLNQNTCATYQTLLTTTPVTNPDASLMVPGSVWSMSISALPSWTTSVTVPPYKQCK